MSSTRGVAHPGAHARGVRSFGHVPLGAWVASTRECVAMLLRHGDAPPNDVADHKAVLAAALAQLPPPLWSKLLIRIDSAAFSHDVLNHLQTLTTGTGCAG